MKKHGRPSRTLRTCTHRCTHTQMENAVFIIQVMHIYDMGVDSLTLRDENATITKAKGPPFCVPHLARRPRCGH